LVVQDSQGLHVSVQGQAGEVLHLVSVSVAVGGQLTCHTHDVKVGSSGHTDMVLSATAKTSH
jgi:hypothetical protein